MNETLEYMMARMGHADRWVPACGGHELPTMTRSGKRLLYCYNFAEMKHAYIDVGTDTVLTDAEALGYLGM